MPKNKKIDRRRFIEKSGRIATAGVLFNVLPARSSKQSFEGEIKVKIGTSNWKKNKLVSTGPGRGIGIIEMATAIRENRLSRVDASLANHVLDVMQTLAESSNSGDCIDINSSCEKPKPVECNY